MTASERNEIFGSAAAILQNVHHAVAAFDKDLRLIFANSDYCRILGLHEDICSPGTPYADIIRHNIANGIYGDVDEQEELDWWVKKATDQQDRTEEIVRPDGTTFRVEKAILPDGGFVLTYVDVTDLKQKERELDEKNRFMEAVLQNAAMGVIIFDAELKLIVANQGIIDLYGFPAHLAEPGTSIRAFVEDRVRRGFFSEAERGKLPFDEHVEERIRRFTEFEIGREETLRERLPNGRTVEVRAFKAEFGALIATYTDITDRVHAEEELKNSETRYRAIVEDQNDMICRFDKDFRLTFVNGAYARAFASKGEDLIGRSFTDLVPNPMTLEVLVSGIRALTPDNPVLTGFYPETTADGDSRWHYWSNRAVFDKNGEIVEYQAVGRDETDRRQAEIALKESERRFRGIAEAHPVPVLIMRLKDAAILHVSPVAVPVLGPDIDTIKSRAGTAFFADGDEYERYTLDFNTSGNGVTQYEMRIRSADGRVFPAEVTARLTNYGGDEAMVIGIVDITDRKVADAEIERQRATLAQSEKMSALGSLLASVAHELNNPLSIVVGQAQLLEDLAPDDKTRTRAEKIKAAADRCARIVKTFLAMARQKPPNRASVDINKVALDALEIASYALHTSGIAVETDLAENLPPAEGDADQLLQVVMNLVINAQHALGDWNGERTIRLQTRQCETGNVQLVVSDTGPGIPQEIKEQVFEPFFTTKPEGVGTGIGLSVCRMIAESHGGQMMISDAEGGGAVFSLSLPVSAGQAPAGPVADENTKIQETGSTVLVVDDEPGIADMLRDILEARGHSVFTAHNGREALAVLDTVGVDMILSDIRMPELDGPGLYAALDASKRFPLNRIVFLTGDTLSANVRSFLGDNRLPYLEKPIEPAEVRRVVDETLSKPAL